MPGWKTLIVCGTAATHSCTFNDLILLTTNLITDLIVLSTLFATMGLAYAGFKLMTSGGDVGALKDAKNTAWSIIKGYLCILIAWLVVYTIMTALVDPSYSLLGKP